MKKLSKEQINEIAEQVSGSSIKSKELKEDLVDHICCIIEDDLQRGSDYEDSRERALRMIFPEGIEKGHNKKIWLIHNQ